MKAKKLNILPKYTVQGYAVLCDFTAYSFIYIVCEIIQYSEL